MKRVEQGERMLLEMMIGEERMRRQVRGRRGK